MTARSVQPQCGQSQRGRARDEGSATVWAILIVLVGGLLTAYVVDGGNAMSARIRTLDLAQQAARAGANQLDLAALRRDGQIRLDPASAEAAATAFLDQADVGGTVTVTATRVTVTIAVDESTLLLRAVGITAIPIIATADAAPTTGP